MRSTEVKQGDKTKDNAGATLVKDEERATGSVSWAAHAAYVRAMGGGLSLFLLVFAVASDKFMAVSPNPNPSSNPNPNPNPNPPEP